MSVETNQCILETLARLIRIEADMKETQVRLKEVCDELAKTDIVQNQKIG